MPDEIAAPAWKVTQWRCACHSYRFVPGPRDARWHVFAGRIRIPGVPFDDVDAIRVHHPDLTPTAVDDQAALLRALETMTAVARSNKAHVAYLAGEVERLADERDAVKASFDVGRVTGRLSSELHELRDRRLGEITTEALEQRIRAEQAEARVAELEDALTRAENEAEAWRR